MQLTDSDFMVEPEVLTDADFSNPATKRLTDADFLGKQGFLTDADFDLPPAGISASSASLSAQSNPQGDLLPFAQDTDKSADALRKKIQEESALKTVGREAGAGVVPTLAGIGGGMLTGAGLGAMGANPFTIVGGAIAGGVLAGFAGEKAQEKTLETVAPEFAQNLAQERALAAELHPVSSFVGSAVPQLLVAKPSLKNVATAYKGAKAMLSGNEVSKAMVDQMLNVGVGAGVNGVQEAYQQYQAGDLNAGRLVAQLVMGAVINEPNKFGVKLGMNPSTGDVEPIDIGAEIRATPVPDAPVTDEARLIGRVAPQDARPVAEVPEVLPPERSAGGEVVPYRGEPKPAIDVEPVSEANVGGRLIGRQASVEIPDLATMADADVVALARERGLYQEGEPIGLLRGRLLTEKDSYAVPVGEATQVGEQQVGAQGVGPREGGGVQPRIDRKSVV